MDNKIERMINASKVRVVLESIIVGIGVGFLVSMYRLILKYILGYTYLAYKFMGDHVFAIIIGLIILAIVGVIVGLMVKDESMISGSGIPQIEGILTGYFKAPSPGKVIIYKFVGGVLAIGSGLSLGIEGPSIQLGASIGHIFGNVTKKLKIEKRFLISSGAGAGLAAAFNAPFAGVLFVLEEVHKKFTPMLFVSAIAASVSSDAVTWIFFGKQPILMAHVIPTLPFRYYGYLIVLGIVVGLGGALYNFCIVGTMGLYSKIKLPIQFRMIIPFVCAAGFGIFLPQVLGGGEGLIDSVLTGKVLLGFAIILLIAKFIFSMISFASGTPGGILFPLLTLGALVGVIFGEVSIQFLGLDRMYLMNFILFAMAGMFSSIVRAPLTGMMLVCEMSGSFTQFGPIILVCGVSYLVAELLRSEPVYESLFKMRLHAMESTEKREEYAKENKGEVVVSYIVSMGSSIAGKKLKEINLGKNVLVISIERSGEILIPNGETVIMAGDTISTLASETKEIQLRTMLEELCECDL
ncbi:ClC family H(+)/Cl(-) exchange transporter [uncultured Clostridium sp.]|uniref:ClC family H(+)/Cl(-) exchange transporter n=1 Tax=uncultured Clostridium sp. TaxID=59620 RepID=UPI00261FA513|nr:ClC family H(+)/Cl(-) exchange transporter [uncultured Clostridium sp.]